MTQSRNAERRRQVNCGLIGVGTVGSAVLDFFAQGPMDLRLSGSEGIGGPSVIPIHIRSASRRARHNPKAAPEDLIRQVLERAGEDGASRFYYDFDPSDPESRFTPGAPAWRRIVSDPEIDIIVEVTGSPVAEAIIQEALWHGKCVVTANKRVMSRSGYELVKLAQARGAVLAYEGSVGGGMPIVQMMGSSIGGNITAILAIVNGTTNFILSRMREQVRTASTPDEASKAYPLALADAIKAGLAEADPSDDVLGEDARSKLIILAGLAFGVRLRPADIYVRGIARRGRLTQESIFTSTDLQALERLGYVPKLLAGAERLQTASGERVIGWVQPVALPTNHPLAGVAGSGNACLMQVESPMTAASGGARGYEIMVNGPGAGGPETASSIIADIRFCAQQIAVAGRVGARRDMAERPVPVYMYGASAFGRSQAYAGAAAACLTDALKAPFFLRFVQRGPASAEDAATIVRALRSSRIQGEALAPGETSPGHTYVMTQAASIRQVEEALEQVLRQFDPGRMALDILYLPVLRHASLERADR